MPPKITSKLEARLRDLALAYPEATEAFPWDHRAFKVNGKAFAFTGFNKETGFSITLKLPLSCKAALREAFAETTGYGLGKHGWITATFPQEKDAPLDLLCAWLDESYRAVAPKKLLAALDAHHPASDKKKIAAKGKAAPPKKPHGVAIKGNATLPDELALALEGEARLLAVWNKLTAPAQEEHAQWVIEAKKPETRHRRSQAVLSLLRAEAKGGIRT